MSSITIIATIAYYCARYYYYYVDIDDLGPDQDHTLYYKYAGLSTKFDNFQENGDKTFILTSSCFICQSRSNDMHHSYDKFCLTLGQAISDQFSGWTCQDGYIA